MHATPKISASMFQRFHLGLLTAIICATAALADDPNSPTGRWITPRHDAVIQIAPCGKNLCGEIVGIAVAHPNDPMPLDWQGAPQCGLTIIQTAPINNPAGVTKWVGVVLDPRNGTVYHAQIALDPSRHLLLHGYVGLPIFGQTETWTPYSGRTLANCKLATASTAAALNPDPTNKG